MYLEIRSQKHLMCVEGSSDIRPTKIGIQKAVEQRGFKIFNINILYDRLQGFWRFDASIKCKC